MVAAPRANEEPPIPTRLSGVFRSWGGEQVAPTPGGQGNPLLTTSRPRGSMGGHVRPHSRQGLRAVHAGHCRVLIRTGLAPAYALVATIGFEPMTFGL